MKKIIYNLLIISTLIGEAISISSCGKEKKPELPKTIKATSVELSDKAVEFTEGEKKELTATVKPSNASDKKLIWESSAETIVSIKASDENGTKATITALKEGTATITVSVKTVPEIKANCTVKVTSSKNKVIINGGAAVPFETGELGNVLPGSVTSLVFGQCNLNEKDIQAIRDKTSTTLESADLEKVTFVHKENEKYTVNKGKFEITAGEMPKEMFYIFKKLTDVKISNNVTSIGKSCFFSCPLTKASIPDNVKSIKKYAFSRCNLSSIEIPESLESLGENSFSSNTKLTSIKLGSKIKDINSSCFINCTSIEKFIVSSSNPNFKTDEDSKQLLTKDGETLISYAFGTINGPDFNVPAIKNIDKSVFKYISAKVTGTITAPEGIETIGFYSFGNNKAKTINLPASLKKIDCSAFSYSENLESIKISATTPPSVIGEYEFLNNCKALKEILVPTASVQKYKEAFGWKLHAAKIKAIK